MLNDSQEAASLLSKVKEELNELFHTKEPILTYYKKMYKEEPADRVKAFLLDIDVPVIKLKEIYELIQLITHEMKQKLESLDPWQCHTYLNTCRDFEEIFNIDDQIKDKASFADKIQEFGHKFKAKDLSNKDGSSSPKGTTTPKQTSSEKKEKKSNKS